MAGTPDIRVGKGEELNNFVQGLLGKINDKPSLKLVGEIKASLKSNPNIVIAQVPIGGAALGQSKVMVDIADGGGGAYEISQSGDVRHYNPSDIGRGELYLHKVKDALYPQEG